MVGSVWPKGLGLTQAPGVRASTEPVRLTGVIGCEAGSSQYRAVRKQSASTPAKTDSGRQRPTDPPRFLQVRARYPAPFDEGQRRPKSRFSFRFDV